MHISEAKKLHCAIVGIKKTRLNPIHELFAHRWIPAFQPVKIEVPHYGQRIF